MSRVQIALAALAGLLLVVLFWLLLWSPQQDELESLRTQAEDARTQQTRLEGERNQLRAVRDEAPEVEAELVAGSSLVPPDPALPSALRQLQTAADDSNTTLRAVSPSRPSQVEGADDGVSSIDVSVQLDGTYFQIVDFLRRVEDPAITPRGLVWTNLSLSRAEYPELSASLGGMMFTQLPSEPEEPEDDDNDDNDNDDDDADVTVEIEEEDE